MGARGVRRQPGGVEHVEHVYTVGHNGLFDQSFDALAGYNSFEFHTQFVG